MRTLLLSLLLICVTIFTGQAQYSRYTIQLTDKYGTAYSLANPAGFLSAKAIERRMRQHIAIDSSDLPVSAAYLDSIRSVANVKLLNTSRWFNQVLIETEDPLALDRINGFPFVKSTAPIALSARFQQQVSPDKWDTPQPLTSGETRTMGTGGSNGSAGITGISTLDYGNSYAQVHLHEGDYLHNLGFTGAGISIAILDAGFYGYKTNKAMDSVRLQGRILAEWDFVANEASVNEDHSHGLHCFSILAANKPGQVMGTAPHASYFLLRSEDAATEYPVEEQNWVAAAEYADSAGADMISSSLGYTNFDDPTFNHSYAERDGHTSLITRGAGMAVRKGMIVMNSAGNSGGDPGDTRFISCPADGDSVFAVGAVTINNTLAGFSSWGPNAAGKRKPNIVSVGQGTVLTSTAGSPATGNGTSYSNPLACGLIACLWQAFPEFNNMEILRAVEQSADKYLNPDDRFGYGLPNFKKAYTLLAQERTIRKQANLLQEEWIRSFPNPYRQQFNVLFKAPADGTAILQLLDGMGRLIDAKSLLVAGGQIYQVIFSNSPKLASGVYFLKYSDGKNKKTLTLMRH